LTKYKPPYAKYFIEVDESQWQVDKYWRTLGYLLQALKYKNWSWKVNNLNWKQIKDWYAWEYTYNKYNPYKYQALFRQYQQYAESKQLGLWAVNTCNWQRKAIDEVKGQTNNSLYDVLNYPTTNELKSWVIHQWDENKCPTKRVYCSQIESCDLAYYYLNTCNATYLDKDWDWVPCESICKK
jgi:hypothetical protein